MALTYLHGTGFGTRPRNGPSAAAKTAAPTCGADRPRRHDLRRVFVAGRSLINGTSETHR